MPPSNLSALRRREAALAERLDDVQDKIARLEALIAGRNPRLRRPSKNTRRGGVARRTRKRARR